MKHSVKSAENHLDRKTVAIIASAVGLAAYLAISLIFSQIRFPNLDEGAYLYKGLQFAEGNYRPFQAYGFWTNKMYLPFYFYGWIQLLFKPGLLAPRLLAVVLGTMSVAGLWIVIRRISNDYFAAIAVWAMALNATMVSIYSIGNSQVVVICELIWIMVLVLGENRKLWQITFRCIYRRPYGFNPREHDLCAPFPRSVYLLAAWSKKRVACIYSNEYGNRDWASTLLA